MDKTGSADRLSESGRGAAPNASTTSSTATLQAPAITLPKGGGAVRGIGEKFAANPAMGTGSMTAPIATSPGRAGVGPQLSLVYDTANGNGPFGFGWSLALPAITRKTEKGLPQYRDEVDSDVFILSGAEDLVPQFKQDEAGAWVMSDGANALDEEPRTIDGVAYLVRRYRPRVEGLFARIERWTRRDDGMVHWRSISKDNLLTLYGTDPGSRIADPNDPRRIFSWLICETRDDKGNAIVYSYKPEDGVDLDLGLAHERNRGAPDAAERATNRYPKRIRYGNRVPLLDPAGRRPVHLTTPQIEGAGWMFEVVFDYGDHDRDAPTPRDDEATDGAGALTFPWPRRQDPFASYRAGFEVRTARLCRRVLMFHHFSADAAVGADCLVQSTDFTYSRAANPRDPLDPAYSFLLAVRQAGYKRTGPASYLAKSMPPVEFSYSRPQVQTTLQELDPASLTNLPAGLAGADYQWTDLHGEGLPGVLSEQAGAWFYKRNLSPLASALADGSQQAQARLAPTEQVALRPSLGLADGAQLMDLAGDGQPDLVLLDGPTPGLFEHDDAEGWEPFRPFAARLNRSARDPNLRFVDLDGDGHADVLITEQDAFVWHPSLAEGGFGPALRVPQARDEERGPCLLFADGSQSIFLADLSGDGLSDLVRVRNGEVCYWPNLGYGRFGARVAMDNAPHFDNPEQFDHKRVRLADIDGTGTADLIYLHRDGVRLFFNQSGNSWSDPLPLPVFPRVDDLVDFTAIDLLGNGTACLVWSSPLPGDAGRQLRYVRLMGEDKPHLLVDIVNNLGAQTRVRYAPSTRFYLRDRLNGTPWASKLPFPVHVVERVETYDRVSRNRFVSRYAYHHGFFDGVEREFRGFGMVEQWDSEEFGSRIGDDDSSLAVNLDAASLGPPIHTKTWFHTGVYLGRERVSNHFAGEYYREPGWNADDARLHLLPDTVLPAGLSIDEEREACRALRGSMLRQELYAEDGSEQAGHPYTVIEQNFTVVPLQPQGANRHGVCFTHAREALSYHYEREFRDPRVQHTLTLEVDAFGNVLRALAVGYGRRAGLSPLQGADKLRQERPLLTYTDSRYTINDQTVLGMWDDAHRAPLPAEVRTFELTGFELDASAVRFTFDDFAADDFAALSALAEIPYELAVPPAGRRKRPIERVRTLYRRDDLSALLAVGTLQPRALPGETYKLAFTPGLLGQIYMRSAEALLPDPALALAGGGADQGGYVDLDGDGHWWIPSGRIFFAPEGVTELDFALAHFFLPHGFSDPFGQITRVAYDSDPANVQRNNTLLLARTEDALGNVTTASNDYRVLQPRQSTDPNGNRSEVAFDALGMLVGTAVMGKAAPAPVEGDSFATFTAELTPAQIAAYFDAPDPRALAAGLLGTATTRTLYDLERVPACAATISRETHVSDLIPPAQSALQLRFSYSDGFGREVQQKLQAEPGPVPQRDADGAIVVDADGQPVMSAADASPRWVGMPT
ncbi:MAG: toxin, partial [Chloroflexales bacterium]|nr:toxin [Chloroflexales bacterium]